MIRKWILAFVLTTIFAVLTTAAIDARPRSASWKYGYGSRAAWSNQGSHDWGGDTWYDYWCVNSGNACYVYDWYVTEEAGWFGGYSVGVSNGTPADWVTVEYGHQNVLAAAAANNVQLPSSFGPPTLTYDGW